MLKSENILKHKNTLRHIGYKWVYRLKKLLNQQYEDGRKSKEYKKAFKIKRHKKN